MDEKKKKQSTLKQQCLFIALAMITLGTMAVASLIEAGAFSGKQQAHVTPFEFDTPSR